MAKPRKYPQLYDHDWLRQKYEAEGLSIPKMAAEIGASPMAVHRALVQAGIERRHPGGGRGRFPALADEQWLRREYVDRERSAQDIAAELGCTDSGVRAALMRLGIKRRSHIEARRLRGQRLREQVDVAAALQQYADGDGFETIGKRYGIAAKLVRELLVDSGLEPRSKAEQTRIELKRVWQREEMQQKLRDRRRPTGVRGMKRAIADGSICAFCGIDGPLQHHHLNAVRSDDRDENLVPLCGDCHRKVEWFISHATAGLRRAYRRGNDKTAGRREE